MRKPPLASVRVIDVTQNVAGPFCTQILADLGADVIKVEPPAGDSTRGWAPPRWREHGVMFAAFNRNKRSIALDLRAPEGRDLLERLIAGADVFVSAFRPATARRLRLDARTLENTHPNLVICEVSAYGHEGPMAEDAGYDPMIQASSGLMSINGHEGSSPARVPTSIIDMAAGMWAAIGTLSCLMQRGPRVGGRLIQTSLFETAVAWMPYQILGFLATGEPPRQWGSELATIVPYGAYQASDRPLMIAVGSEHIWRSFCTVLERVDLIDNSGFATNTLRVANREKLRRLIEEVLRSDTASGWVRRLSEAGVPATVVNTIPEMLEHPQTEATGILQTGATEDLPLIGLPVSIDGHRPPIRRSPPRNGEHTRSVLSEDLEMSDAEITALESSGVIGRR